MAKKFKDYYNTDCARLLAAKIDKVSSGFDSNRFIDQVKTGIRGREFLARQDVFAQALVDHLGSNYKKNLQIFTQILGPSLQQDTGMFTYGYWLWPIGRYIEQQAPQHWPALPQTLKFIHQLTQRFTGEFAIRPLLANRPQRILPTLKKWSQDDSVHVRRLASEALRVRLPWAAKMSVFHDHFEPCFEILDRLKQAPEKFVQKSVGNNINDLYKDRPDLAEKIVKSWQKHHTLSPHTLWIIKHGQRSLKATRQSRI